MLGVREHIDRLDGGDLVLVGKKSQVTGLGSRVTADIDHTGRGGLKDYLGDIRMDAGARRIENDHIRLTVLIDEITAQDILHVSGEELTISDAVPGGVHLRILNRLGNIFDANHFGGLAGNELSYGACACV